MWYQSDQKTGALACLSLFIIVRRAKAKWPRPQGPVARHCHHVSPWYLSVGESLYNVPARYAFAAMQATVNQLFWVLGTYDPIDGKSLTLTSLEAFRTHCSDICTYYARRRNTQHSGIHKYRPPAEHVIQTSLLQGRVRSTDSLTSSFPLDWISQTAVSTRRNSQLEYTGPTFGGALSGLRAHFMRILPTKHIIHLKN